MSHLDRADLIRWRDEGAERERVLGHLAGCDACRRAYADLVRLDAPADPPGVAPEFLARGLAVRRRRSALWIAAPAAAAAALLVVLAWPRPRPESAIRGEELVAVASGRPDELRWMSPYRSVRYRVVVRDASGAGVFRAETAEERARIALPRGRYTWTVEALDMDGRSLAVSAPQSLELP